MKKFRVKNLTVAVGAEQQLKRCGVNFSCPGGAGSFCGISNACQFPTNFCGVTVGCPVGTLNCGVTVGCPAGTLNCGVTIGCPAGSIDCLISRGCGVNFSTLPPTDFTNLIQEVGDITDKLDLIDVMKLDLNSALKNLSEAEEGLTKAAQPQTLAEAKEVEKNLESALAEVKGLVKELK